MKGDHGGLIGALLGVGKRHREGRKSRDTACLTYRCFLPDLTRFVSVCCAGSGHKTMPGVNDPRDGF